MNNLIDCNVCYNIAKQSNDRKSMVLFYLLAHYDTKVNVFFGTYNKIAKDTGISHPTVAKIMQSLQNTGTILKINNGAWRIAIMD